MPGLEMFHLPRGTMYLHLLRRKAASAASTDPDNGRRLWESGERMLATWDL